MGGAWRRRGRARGEQKEGRRKVRKEADPT